MQNVFSGVMARVFAITYDDQKNVLGYRELFTLQTISISSFSPSQPVRTCGLKVARGLTEGTISVAGTCIFLAGNKDGLSIVAPQNAVFGDSIMLCMLPLLDLMILAADETTGAQMTSYLYGVKFTGENVVFSVENTYTESPCTFTAQDWDPPRVFQENNNVKALHNPDRRQGEMQRVMRSVTGQLRNTMNGQSSLRGALLRQFGGGV